MPVICVNTNLVYQGKIAIKATLKAGLTPDFLWTGSAYIFSIILPRQHIQAIDIFPRCDVS
jgi:hypothetical protein